MKWKPNWKEMKRWKKIALIAIALIILFQIPFIYRRIRLGNLHSAIQQLNAERVVDSNQSEYADYKGLIHVHSNLGGHSSGRFEDIINAVK